jgi:hypothetical protein
MAKSRKIRFLIGKIAFQSEKPAWRSWQTRWTLYPSSHDSFDAENPSLFYLFLRRVTSNTENSIIVSPFTHFELARLGKSLPDVEDESPRGLFCLPACNELNASGNRVSRANGPMRSCE